MTDRLTIHHDGWSETYAITGMTPTPTGWVATAGREEDR